jgi:hypothetical protein
MRPPVFQPGCEVDQSYRKRRVTLQLERCGKRCFFEILQVFGDPSLLGFGSPGAPGLFLQTLFSLLRKSKLIQSVLRLPEIMPGRNSHEKDAKL